MKCGYCGSNKTSIGRKKGWIWENWIKWEGIVACSKCYKHRYDKRKSEIRGKVRKRQKLDGVERRCVLCNSTTTRIVGTNRTAPYPRWYCYKDGAICYRCEMRVLWWKRARRKGVPIRSFHDNRPLVIIIRKCPKYLDWRWNILERDMFRCQDCGGYEKLHIHHIKPFLIVLKENHIDTFEKAMNCDELWDSNNGLTLCRKCHEKRDPRRII